MREIPFALGTREAAEILADVSRTGEPVSIQFINQLIHKDVLKARLIGRSWVINGQSFSAYYKRRYDKKHKITGHTNKR